ncbi:MAG: hypothetical protein LIO87_06770 [Eubacterium sp.]|nr:hypothetical protein [Eubacterium sp.]
MRRDTKIKPFCFSTIMEKFLDGMSVNESGKKMNLINNLFVGYIQDKKMSNLNFDLDPGNISRWFSGEERPSPAIADFYKNKGDLAYDIQNKVFPLLVDKDKVVEELYDLLVKDKWLSESKKAEVSAGYPYSDDEEEKANFMGRAVFLSLQMGKLLFDPKTGQPIDYSEKSPNPEDYLRNNVVPKPQRNFCGREKELQEVHAMLESESKIFIKGIAGIGKSEFVKA